MKVMVVESDAALRRAIEEALVAASHEVRALSWGVDALEWIESFPPDVLVVGLGLSDVAGEKVARAADALPLPPRIVLISGDAEQLERASAVADAVFRMPLDLAEFMSLMEFYQRRTSRR
jgi:DNA-binding response OmpR family regulator